jgi:nicotinamide mononucleotide (NMN) deamidase PncC
MAVGALNASGAMIAVANTGVADDAQEDEGGTQCYAWALMRGERQVVVSETVRFDGDRVEIRKQAARHGLMQIPERLAQLERKLAEQS